jgi:putative tricarboxylic transport membrane protein
MNTIELLFKGIQACMDPMLLLLCAAGSFMGAIVGVLPGLGPATAIAILLPLIYGKAPLPALVMLAGIYYGASSGGSITSIALNVPGESQSVVTCFDGYPLLKQGKGGKAMGIAILFPFWWFNWTYTLNSSGYPSSKIRIKIWTSGIFCCLFIHIRGYYLHR